MYVSIKFFVEKKLHVGQRGGGGEEGEEKAFI